MRALRISRGERGIAETLTAMLAYCRNPETVPLFRRLALWITKDTLGKEAQARAIYHWVSSRVRYVHDPDGIEFLIDPVDLACKALHKSPEAAEDCEGQATLVAALCSSIGFPARFVVSEDPSHRPPRDENWWAHVHGEVWTGRGWLPMDTALSWVPFGCRVQGGKRSFVELGDVPDEHFDEALSEGPDSLGFVSSLITTSADLVKSLVGARASVKVAKAQQQSEMAYLDAQERLAKAEAEIAASERQLAEEREARRLAEIDAEGRLRQSTWVDAALSVGIASLGVWALKEVG